MYIYIYTLHISYICLYLYVYVFLCVSNVLVRSFKFKLIHVDSWNHVGCPFGQYFRVTWGAPHGLSTSWSLPTMGESDIAHIWKDQGNWELPGIYPLDI